MADVQGPGTIARVLYGELLIEHSISPDECKSELFSHSTAGLMGFGEFLVMLVRSIKYVCSAPINYLK
jgi:hypothetical protein